MTYRIAAPPYMNSKPLVWGLESEESVECRYLVPSKIAEMLEARELSAGLVSVPAVFTNSNLRIVPDISISCEGPAESVKLFHNCTIPERLQTVAVDESSLSSSLLARIILKEQYGVTPLFIPMAPSIPDMLATCDAAVTIGDTTMCAAKGRYGELDLGEEWHRLTSLPFVFAVWAVNPDMASARLVEILRRAKQIGLSHLPAITKAESLRLGLPEDTCYRYLNTVMDYDLDDRHIGALNLFREKVSDYGVHCGAHDIRLIE